MNAESFLAELARIKSLSREESAAADFVFDAIHSWGYAPQRRGNNVWFTVGKGDPHLLFNSHLDTVPPCEGWEIDPWAGEWIDGKLTALGANDAKGCGTAMLFAARSLAESTSGRVTVLLVAEEEIGGPGGIGPLLPELGSFDAGVVGEPTGLNVCTAQRGMLLLRCVAHGISGHVAHSQIGDNAIHKAARDIGRLAAMEFPPDPILGQTRAQVTTIQGGLQRNQIPDRCEFFVDFRTTPALDHNELTARLRDELETEMIVHSERYLPCSVAVDHAVTRAALAASPNPEPVGSATVSDWAFFGSIPAVKVGPGDTLRSHTANEFLTADELRAGVAFYAKLAENYFQEASRG